MGRADLALEVAEHAVIVVDDPEEDLGRDVLDVGRAQDEAPGVRHVVDHVVDQAHVPVDEVVPGTRLVAEAAIEQLAVDVAEGHGRSSSPGKGRKSHSV